MVDLLSRAFTNHYSLITKKREPVFEDYLAGAQVMSNSPFLGGLVLSPQESSAPVLTLYRINSQQLLCQFSTGVAIANCMIVKNLLIVISVTLSTLVKECSGFGQSKMGLKLILSFSLNLM